MHVRKEFAASSQEQTSSMNCTAGHPRIPFFLKLICSLGWGGTSKRKGGAYGVSYTWFARSEPLGINLSKQRKFSKIRTGKHRREVLASILFKFEKACVLPSREQKTNPSKLSIRQDRKSKRKGQFPDSRRSKSETENVKRKIRRWERRMTLENLKIDLANKKVTNKTNKNCFTKDGSQNDGDSSELAV